MDYYSILGIDRSATADDIKKAYRKLAMLHHPDRAGDTPESVAKFQDIQKAYAILSDPDKKAEYDNPTPQGRQFHFTHGEMPDEFMDQFAEFFGHHPGFSHFARKRQPKNKDLQIVLELSLVDTLIEQEKTLSIKNSNGERFTIQVKVPRGVQPGTTIRIPGQGDNVIPNISRGDLYINVHVHVPDEWNVMGEHLVRQVNINAFEAMLGLEKELTAIDGKTFRITIPPGTQNDTKMALRGQGLYIYGRDARGDIILVIKVDIPRSLTDEQKELIKKIQTSL